MLIHIIIKYQSEQNPDSLLGVHVLTHKFGVRCNRETVHDTIQYHQKLPLELQRKLLFYLFSSGPGSKQIKGKNNVT
jgi:hypothetical protein